MDTREIDTLTRLDDWQLKDGNQDLRGKTLVAGAAIVGRIDDMLADTGEERIVALILDDDRLINIDDVEVRDGQPFLLIDPGALIPAAADFDRAAVRRTQVPASTTRRT